MNVLDSFSMGLIHEEIDIATGTAGQASSGTRRDPHMGNRYTVSNRPQAHHIVALGASASTTRDILTNPPVCIGIDDAINGIFLPYSDSYDNHLTPKRVYHVQTFASAYYSYVDIKISSVPRTHFAVYMQLLAIRNELEHGIINW